MAKTTSLMYALYGHPRYFKFKRKYQQRDPCFETIFPLLMTMMLIICLIINELIQNLNKSYFPNNVSENTTLKVRMIAFQVVPTKKY